MAGDKFIPELHLIQPGFNYGACGPFTKQSERIYNFRETVNVKHLYRNKLDKACFAHDAAYSDSKDLAKNIFQIRFQIIELMEMLEIGNMMDIKKYYQVWYISFGLRVSINRQLAEELYKPVIKKIQKKKSLWQI